MGPALTRQNRFFVPDEADPHTRTFMQWPVNRQVHPDRYFLDDLQATIAQIANTIVDFEPVVMLMAQEDIAGAQRLLSGSVEIWPIPTEDLWARDSGPLFVTDGQGNLAIRHMNFNGWGDKQVHARDGQIARLVAEHMGLPLLDNGVVGEPGGVEADGHGLLMAHESSWVNPNRNTQTRDVIEALLLEAYGAERMIWAPGIAGEDITDYHIDSLARFVGPGKALIQLPAEHDPGDLWNDVPHQTYDILEQALEMEVIYEPEQVRVRSQDFVASYVNYYLCNQAVICAQFGDSRRDGEAVDMLGTLYPGREIITLNVDALGEVGGGIHCATREQPAV
jgi:agmatine deiminase